MTRVERKCEKDRKKERGEREKDMERRVSYIQI